MEKGKKAAVLVPILRGTEPALIFEVRSATVYQPGEICFPGGGMEVGETPEACALRETEEELGLNRTEIHLLGRLDPMLHISSCMVYPVIGSVLPASLEQLAPSEAEVAEVFTVPLQWFRENPPQPLSYDLVADMDTVPEVLRPFVEHYRNRRTTPVWVWKNHVIWGLTARIIEVLLKKF